MKKIVRKIVNLASSLAVFVFLCGPVRLHAAPYLYLTDSTFGAVDVIDTRDNSTVKVIPVGQQPTDAVLNQDASRLFVLNRSDGTTSIIDTRELKVIATIPVGPVPYALEVFPDGKRFYVITGSAITQYRVADGAPLCATEAAPLQDFTLSPDGTRLYAADYFNNVVRVYDAGTCSTLTTIDAQDPNSIQSVAVSADGQTLYVISLAVLSVVRLSDSTVLAHVIFGSGGGEAGPTIALSPDGKFAYANDIDGEYVAAINLATYDVTRIFMPGNELPLGLAVSANGSRLYVAGGFNGTAEISTQTNRVIRTLAGGISTTGVRRRFLGAPRPEVYIAESGANRVSVIDTGTQTIEQQIPVGMAPSSISVAPDALRLYVTNQTDNTVSVVSAVTQSAMESWPTGGTPVASEVTLDGSTLYVANATDASVSVIDTNSGNITTTISLNDAHEPPTAMGLSADGANAYVVAESNLCTVQTATNSYPGGCLFFGPRIGGVATSPDSSTLYVTSSDEDELMILDPNEVASINVGPSGQTTFHYLPKAVAVSPDGDYVYTADVSANAVSVINTVSRTVSAVIGVDAMPVALGVTPDGRFVYVANRTGNSVSVIDTSSNTVVHTIAGLSSPSAVGNIVEPFRDSIFASGFGD